MRREGSGRAARTVAFSERIIARLARILAKLHHYRPACTTGLSRLVPEIDRLLTYNVLSPMKAYVYVSLKKSVLDPQGKTIHGALKKMGYKGLEEVRQGKYFEITLDGGLTRAEAEAEVTRIAGEVLTNPVIEEFRFSLEE